MKVNKTILSLFIFIKSTLKELEDYGINFVEKEVPYLGYNPESIKG